LSLIFLPDKSLASAILFDSLIRIWNPFTGALIRNLTGHTSAVASLALISDNTLASGSYDRTILIWDLAKGQTIKILTGHTSTIWGLVLLSDNTIASTSFDNTIRIWNPTSSVAIKTITPGYTNPFGYLALLSDQRLVSGSGGTNSLLIWN